MTLSLKMLAPNQTAEYTVTVQSGTTYTADANGIISSVSPGDAWGLLQAGCIPVPQQAVVTLSTADTIVQGAVNVLSTAASALTLYDPVYSGQATTIIQNVASTAACVVTSSGCYIGSSYTTATFTGVGYLTLQPSVNSSQWMIAAQRALTSSAGAAVTYQPAIT